MFCLVIIHIFIIPVYGQVLLRSIRGKLQLTMYKQWIKLPFEPRQFAFLFWQYQ